MFVEGAHKEFDHIVEPDVTGQSRPDRTWKLERAHGCMCMVSIRWR